MPAPLISFVLPVKNAMPHVRGMIESVRRQTFRDFELIIQDGGSTDETLPYLNSIDDLPRIDIVSEPDSGIGQAYNRGIARTTGQWICLIAADEWLDPDALERGVAWFTQHPDAAIIYCGIRLADSTGRVSQIFIPPAFDLTRFLHCEISTNANAAFINRKRIGEALYYDESLRTCPDYDFWIRLGSKFDAHDLVPIGEAITTALADRTSMSYRVEAFDQFIRDKRGILDRYIASLADQSNAAVLRASATAGILSWAAETVFGIGGVSPDFVKYCREAAQLAPDSPRLARLARKSEAFEIDQLGRFTANPTPQPVAPLGDTRTVAGSVAIDEIHSPSYWDPAEVQSGLPVRVVTGPGPWSYSALLPLKPGSGFDQQFWYWAKLSVQVQSGQVAIGLMTPDDILSESLIAPEDGRVDVFVRLSRSDSPGIMIRNGSLGGPSAVDVFSVTVESARKSPA